MHICHIMSLPMPPEDGIGNYVFNVSKHLVKMGHSVTIITRNDSLELQKYTIGSINVIKIPFVPLYPFYMHIHGKFLNRIIKSIEPVVDIIHIHSPLVPYINTSLPIAVTFHTLISTENRHAEIIELNSIAAFFMGKLVSIPIEKKHLKRVNLITAVSASIAQELNEYGVDAKNVEVLGNGVDETLFTPILKKAEDRYILYTGRLAYRKGLFDLIECAKIICDAYPNISFIIVGKGPLKEKLEKKIISYDLSARFEFKGFVDHQTLIKLYQNAALSIVPSHYEGLPTTLLEAMSCGLPIVCTEVSGNREVVSSLNNGIIVPPKSPKEMARAVSMLLDDENLSSYLGANARKTIEEKYTWCRISQRLADCYKRICF